LPGGQNYGCDRVFTHICKSLFRWYILHLIH